MIRIRLNTFWVDLLFSLNSYYNYRLRDKYVIIKNKTFPQLDVDNKRAEFLPVEWRSSLTLDGGNLTCNS